MAVSLERFFNPRSVAFVGATDDLSKFGGKCLASLFRIGYEGPVYPVNPKRRTLFDRICYPSIAEVPQVPDHVGIALPAAVALDALEECARLRVPFATLFTAGFAESATDVGHALQRRLSEICARTGIRVMGPNCNGLINYVDRFAFTSTAALTGERMPPGDIGVVSQSGGAGQINVMWRAQQAGMRIGYQVSSGNDADLNLLDYVDFMLDAESTRIVLVIAERIADGRQLQAVADKARQLDKVIAMVKVGRSAAGARAAASHTGSLTGADDVADAALRQYGIIRAQDPADLVELARLMRRRNRPRGRRVAAVSISGGNLVMAVDLASDAGLEWPDYAESTRSAIRRWMPSFGSVANPTDLTAAAIGTDEALTSAGRIILDDPDVDTLVPVLTMAKANEINAVADLALTSDKPVVVLWTGGCVDDPTLTIERLVERGVPAYRDAVPCFRAIAAAAWLASRRERLRTRVAGAVAAGDAPAMPVEVPSQAGTLTERASKRLLAAFGIPVTREMLARTVDEAVAAAGAIGGEVALKIESVDIAHKTEAKAIRLNLHGEEAVRTAFSEVMAAARAYRPDARIDGVLVQEMAGPGVELLIGMTTDPVFGPVITAGAGGIFVETLGDLARRIVPVDETAAEEMLHELRVHPVLAGTRGRGACDVAAAVRCIVAVSRLAERHGDRIAEIDINPLLVHPVGQGASVVDALVVARAAGPATGHRAS